MKEKRLQLRIVEKKWETAEAVTLSFEPVDGQAVPYQSGQFLTFIFERLGPAQARRRSYSISSTPGVDPRLSVTVKKQLNGLVSSYLVDFARVGDTLIALPPAGQFTLPPAEAEAPRDIFFFGAGSGITPLYSLLKQVLRYEPLAKANLVYANTRESSTIFLENIHQLAQRHSKQFTGVLFFSNPEQPRQALKDVWSPLFARRGRLSNALVEELTLRHLTYEAARAQFFVCGPRNFMIKAENALGYLGFGAGQVHREIFTVSAPFRPKAGDYPVCEATILGPWGRRMVTVRSGQTILEAAEAEGWSLPYSCRSGICTTCSGHCLEGQVDMYTQEGKMDTAATRGLTLICVGYPRTKAVTIDMGK